MASYVVETSDGSLGQRVLFVRLRQSFLVAVMAILEFAIIAYTCLPLTDTDTMSTTQDQIRAMINMLDNIINSYDDEGNLIHPQPQAQAQPLPDNYVDLSLESDEEDDMDDDDETVDLEPRRLSFGDVEEEEIVDLADDESVDLLADEETLPPPTPPSTPPRRHEFDIMITDDEDTVVECYYNEWDSDDDML